MPASAGGSALGPRAFAEINAILAEADPSVAMIYMMHVCATEVIVAGAKATKSPVFATALQDMSRGKHLTTLAFSEAGSRSHFWAPISRASRTAGGVQLNARKSWVTSAGFADSYVVTTLSSEAKGPTDSTLYLVPRSAPGLHVAAPWDGLGLRATASSPMTLEAVEVGEDRRLTDEGGGFAAKLNIVLPWFNLASATVALGICRAAVGATVTHLKTSRFEHLGNTSLGEALPTLRQTLAQMRTHTDGLAHRCRRLPPRVENPGPATMLQVLEVKASAGETATRVTSQAMHACGGAAFSKHTSIEPVLQGRPCRVGDRRPRSTSSANSSARPCSAFLSSDGSSMLETITGRASGRTSARRRRFRVEVVLYLSYEAQVAALLAGRIDIAWNTNLAYLQSEHLSHGRCRPLAMRDTDREWWTEIVARKGGPVRQLSDLRGKRLALGSRDSGHAAILPVHFLAEAGLVEGRDYQSVRFNTDLGKHGDTGRARWTSSGPSSTARPTPARWAAHSGRASSRATSSPQAPSSPSGPLPTTTTACSPPASDCPPRTRLASPMRSSR